MRDESLHPVDALAEEFVERLRQGQPASIEDYAQRYPQYASDIRDLFPALAALERGKPGTADVRPAPALDSADLLPKSLGDYRIIREVGRGGMGIVYEAEQCSLNRRVAIKVLGHPIAHDTQALLRFRREARCAARLHHTNIVPVYEIGYDSGHHFYTMQFIQGHSLHDVIKELVRLRSSMTPTTPSAANGPNGNRPKTEAILERCVVTTRIAQHLLSGRIAPEATNIGSDVGEKCAATDFPNSESLQLDPSPVPLPRDNVGPEAIEESSPLARESVATYFDAVAGIGIQVADALAYAHDQGVLHRDIKPANLLMDIHGTVWLTDFGLAKEDVSELTQTGEVLGTLKYIPPERFRGITDPRGDVYSLGLTLYELLTLRSDRTAPRLSPTAMANGSRFELPMPRHVNPAVPRDLETIVMKASAKELTDRYRSARDLAQDLRCFQSRLPIQARRATWATKSWLWCRRNRLLAGMTVAVAILLVGSGVGGVAYRLIRQQRDRAVQAELAAGQAQLRAEAAEELALARQHLSRATSARLSGIPGSRQRALDEIRQAVRRDRDHHLRQEIRDEAIAVLAMIDIRTQLLPWETLLPRNVAARLARRSALGALIPWGFARDLQQCAILESETDTLWIVDLNRQSARGDLALSELGFPPNASLYVMWCETGATLTVHQSGGDRRLVIVDSRTGDRVYAVNGVDKYAISPDGRCLAFARGDPKIQLVDLTLSSPSREVDVPWAPEHLRFDAKGSRLAVGYSDRGPLVTILDVPSATVLMELQVGAHGASYADWCYNGTDLILAGGTSGRFEVWDLSRRRRIYKTDDRTDFAWGCWADPLGRFFTTSHWSSDARIWDAQTGTLLGSIPGTVIPHWSPDGDVIGSRLAPLGLEMIYVDCGTACQTLPNIQRPDNFTAMRFVRFSPDQRFIVARMASMNDVHRYCVIWDAKTRRLLGTLDVDRLDEISFSQDGRYLSLFHDNGFSQLPLVRQRDGSCQLGPPETDHTLGISIGDSASAVSSDGLCAACIKSGHLMVKTWETPAGPISTSSVSHPTGRTSKTFRHKVAPLQDKVALSPDGRWATTSGWHSPVTSIWDLRRGRVANELPFGSQVHMIFSPDSTQLVTSYGAAYHFWDVKSMEIVSTLPRSDYRDPGPIAVSRDGTLAICCLRPGGLDVVRLPEGRVLFRLQRPKQLPPYALALSSDGTLVIDTAGIARDRWTVVWDLVRLEQELNGLGLDLEELNLPANRPEVESTPSLEFIGCETLRAPVFIGMMSEVDAQRKLDGLEELYLADPQSAHANEFAWNLLMAPLPLRDVPRARELAEIAMKASPNSDYRNTLAAACYRSGQFERAVQLLRENLQESSDADLPWDFFFLAMSYAAMEQPVEAKSYLRLAERWMAIEHNGQAAIEPECEALYAEAKAAIHD